MAGSPPPPNISLITLQQTYVPAFNITMEIEIMVKMVLPIYLYILRIIPAI